MISRKKYRRYKETAHGKEKCMATLTYKCPSCGSPLIYDGQAQEMACHSCGNTFEVETVQQVNTIEKQTEQRPETTNWQVDDKPYSPQEASRTRSFSCSSCGAELITDETTVATNCAFCGSPSIMPTQFSEVTRPSRIIPFTITKEQATNMFHGYFKGKKLIPNLFKKNNTIDEIRQLYVPYWLFTCQADAQITYNATNVRTFRQGQYRVTQTRHFVVHRAGTLDFSDLPVDASSMMDNAITESIEPYHMDGAINFVPETLSGALANRADVSIEESKRRADQRIQSTTESAFRSTVVGYSSVIPRSTNIRIPDGKSVSALYPLWHITTKKENKVYTFAINGQTGELTCDIPFSKAKLFSWFFGIAGAITAGGFAVLLLLAYLGVLK